MESPVRVVFLVEMPARLLVKADVLGTSWRLPADVTFVLPRADNGDKRLLPPAVPGGDEAVRRFEHDLERPWDPFWGRSRSWRNDTNEILEAGVSRCIAVAPYDDALVDERTFSNTIAGSLRSWLELLADWLEVLAAADLLGDDVPSGRRTHDVSNLPMAIGADGALRWFTSTDRLPIQVINWPAVRLAEWARAVRLAGEGVAVPAAQLLLRDARAARIRGDRRKAVIDAATSCEVALAASIGVELTGRGSPELVERMLHETTGIVELFNFHAALGLGEPLSQNRLKSQIAGTRNRAVHAGHVPSLEEMTRCLEASGSLVAALTPLPP